MRGGHWELSPRGSPYSCSVGPGRSLKTRGHADGEKRRLSKLRGKQEGMPRRESSGKGPRGRQKAELGLQWEGAGEGGTSRGGIIKVLAFSKAALYVTRDDYFLWPFDPQLGQLNSGPMNHKAFTIQVNFEV